MNPSELLRKVLHTVEMPLDAVKFRVKRGLHLFDPIHIYPYRGYGNAREAKLLGRVMEDREIGSASDGDPWWRNALSMSRRFTTDEIPGVRLRGTLFGQSEEVETDNEGYFDLRFEFDERPPNGDLWHEVELELLDTITSNDKINATGRVLIPPQDAEFGVISDIDDTVLMSSATDGLRMAWLTFSNNAKTRTPFPHVAPFYQALQRGSRGAGPNPIFYVSSSAWNIFDLLSDFMSVHEIPEGPIFLRDLGIDSNKLIKTDHNHKLERIKEILETYPQLPFILIGDSGQRDPWLYREAVEEFPDRIAAVYIRRVREKRRKEIEEIAGELKGQGIDMLLMEDARDAAEHACSAGMITEEALQEIRRAAEREDKEEQREHDQDKG